jgi:hypothetical protein
MEGQKVLVPWETGHKGEDGPVTHDTAHRLHDFHPILE